MLVMAQASLQMAQDTEQWEAVASGGRALSLKQGQQGQMQEPLPELPERQERQEQRELPERQEQRELPEQQGGLEPATAP